MRTPSPTRRAFSVVLAAVCTGAFAYQIYWLARLMLNKWSQGFGQRPASYLEIETDLLFLISIVLSLFATAVNDFGWSCLTEFRRRLPASAALLVVLVVAFGMKVKIVVSGSTEVMLIPALDFLQATIWLYFLGGGIRIWHKRNGGARCYPLSRKLKWFMLAKLGGLFLLWLYQGGCLAGSTPFPNFASFLCDFLYWTGMLVAWMSYLERRGWEVATGLWALLNGKAVPQKKEE